MLWVFVLFALPTFAQDALTEAGKTADDAPLWVKVVAGFWMLVAAIVLPYIRSRIKKGEKDKEKAEAKTDALDTLANAVASVYLTVVQPTKAAGTKIDGKAVRALAFNKAKEMAPEAAKAVYEAWGKDKVLSLIHRIANKQGANKPSILNAEPNDGVSPSPA
jgi:hypothetical protein